MTGLVVTEEDLREAVRVLAAEHGWIFYFTKDSRYSPAGFPDLVLVRGPRLMFRELKRDVGPKGGLANVMLRPEQEVWRDALIEVSTAVALGGTRAEVTWAIWRPRDYYAGTILTEMMRDQR